MNIVGVKYLINGYVNDFVKLYLKNILALILALISYLLYIIKLRHLAFRSAMASCRYSLNTLACRVLRDAHVLTVESLLPLVSKGVSREEAAGRSIIIKWPLFDNALLVQKGVIVITFTRTLSYYIRNINLNSMSDYFHFVLEPSWSGYADGDILAWAAVIDKPVFIQATEIEDQIFLNNLSSNLIPLSFGASNWVDYRNFSPTDDEKSYDSIYVANTTLGKRVARYLRAIRKISLIDASYRACLVCAGWGGQEAAVRWLLEYYEVSEVVDIYFSVRKQDLNVLLNKSKVNILLSLKEGSNRSLFESMFCDLPVICVAENIGVNKSYVNENTGIVVHDQFLEDALIYMKKNFRNFQPREWAMNNLSPEITTQKLMSVIRAHSSEDFSGGRAVYVKTNSPEVKYLDFKGFDHAMAVSKMFDIFEIGAELDLQNSLHESVQGFLMR